MEDRHDPAKRRKGLLNVTGQTTEGHLVVDVFRLVESKGVDLELVLEHIKDNDLVPDWIGFYENALKSGWHPERTLHKLEICIRGVYGEEYFGIWQERMQGYLKVRDQYRKLKGLE